ncbi:restriction endonuclease subunit S [Dechloromonas sp. ARDL1]|uniref:restriction endonuclease subunit S n=1 Tax=Dechloromonas sp. ARDL1 TaxID=3322121 RepID=UPI003DA76CBC
MENSRLQSGDIVFARTGATTGKSFLIGECPTDTVFASYLIRVRPKESVEPKFIAHFFQTSDYWGQITKGARGAAQPGVNATTLKALEIPLPPLHEQRRIAAILDQADALRAKRREALAQLDSLTQSIFVELFGDPVANPKGWVVQPLLELSERVQIGPFGSQLHEEDYIDDGIPLVNPTHIKDGEIYPDWTLTVPESKYQRKRPFMAVWRIV